MKMIRHVLIILASLFLLVGIPVFQTDAFWQKIRGTDAVSSATTVLEQPSGAYVVLINPNLHKDTEKLSVWKKFFRGEEIDYIFEDISCVVADMDAAGIELAKSFQSRLPENQMRIRKENITFMLSKIGYGKFDVALLSKEVFQAYQGAAFLPQDQVVVLEEDGK